MAMHAKNFDLLTDAIESFDYKISLDPSNVQVHLAGLDVSETIRTNVIASMVSEIARDPRVREQQREDARQRIRTCEKPGIIVEGRDITTVVAPSAQVRVLLTASDQVRLARRGKDASEDAEVLVSRDKADSQVAEFLIPAAGVALLDTTNLNFEESVTALMSKIQEVMNV
jgi:cytidylate kinase